MIKKINNFIFYYNYNPNFILEYFIKLDKS